MTKIKEDLKLLDYLKEKGISYDDIKAMIEESIEEHQEVEEEKTEEPEVEPEEPEEPEEVPSFTKDDVKEMVTEEVKKALKIKRKVPSKGRLLDESEEDRAISKKLIEHSKIKKNWFEKIV